MDESKLKDSLMEVALAGEALRKCGDASDRQSAAKTGKLAQVVHDTHRELQKARDTLDKHPGVRDIKPTKVSAPHDLEKSLSMIGGHGVDVLDLANVKHRANAGDPSAYDKKSNEVFAAARDAIDAHLAEHAPAAAAAANAMSSKAMSRAGDHTFTSAELAARNNRIAQDEQHLQSTIDDNPLVKFARENNLVPK